MFESAEIGHAIDKETYEAWFIRQVQASIDDPRPSISDEVSRKLMADKRARLRRLKDCQQ